MIIYLKTNSDWKKMEITTDYSGEIPVSSNVISSPRVSTITTLDSIYAEKMSDISSQGGFKLISFEVYDIDTPIGVCNYRLADNEQKILRF